MLKSEHTGQSFSSLKDFRLGPLLDVFESAGNCIWYNTGRNMSAHLHLETHWTLWPY